jgi:hypothetical protein
VFVLGRTFPEHAGAYRRMRRGSGSEQRYMTRTTESSGTPEIGRVDELTPLRKTLATHISPYDWTCSIVDIKFGTMNDGDDVIEGLLKRSIQCLAVRRRRTAARHDRACVVSGRSRRQESRQAQGEHSIYPKYDWKQPARPVYLVRMPATLRRWSQLWNKGNHMPDLPIISIIDDDAAVLIAIDSLVRLLGYITWRSQVEVQHVGLMFRAGW